MRLFAKVLILFLSTQSVGFTCPVNESDIDTVQEKHAKKLKAVRNDCYVLGNKTACSRVAASKAVPLPAMVATPELMDEVKRSNALCKNWSRTFDFWKRKLNMLELPRARVVSAKPAVVKLALPQPAPVPVVIPAPEPSAKSNPDILEIKLRDYVISQIRTEVEKHLDDLPLNDADIHVLSLTVCNGSPKPVTGHLVKYFHKKSKKFSELCNILNGGAK